MYMLHEQVLPREMDLSCQRHERAELQKRELNKYRASRKTNLHVFALLYAW